MSTGSKNQDLRYKAGATQRLTNCKDLLLAKLPRTLPTAHKSYLQRGSSRLSLGPPGSNNVLRAKGVHGLHHQLDIG